MAAWSCALDFAAHPVVAHSAVTGRVKFRIMIMVQFRVRVRVSVQDSGPVSALRFKTVDLGVSFAVGVIVTVSLRVVLGIAGVQGWSTRDGV